MAVEIQIPVAPSSRQRVKLGDDFFLLDLRWNLRAGAWLLDVFDDADVGLIHGIVLRVSVPLLGRHVGRGLPPGELVAVDTSGADSDPGRNDLGGRVKLLYLDPEDLA